MDIRHISEIDLNGVLFVHFPDDLSLEQSRERLELEIMFAAMEDGEEVYEPCISPYWIVRALQKRAYEAYMKLHPQQRREAIVRARGKRFSITSHKQTTVKN